MLKVGITGGIGSGKSVVSKIIETLGFTVFNSDMQAKSIINNDQQVREELIKLFGTAVYTEDGLNREFLADKIFADPTLLQNVNQIVHPKVRAAFDHISKIEKKKAIFNEAAILIETGAYKDFDKIILVSAPEDLRIERVMNRDNISEQEVKLRIANQWSDEKKAIFADVIITNDEVCPLLIQIENFIDQLISS